MKYLPVYLSITDRKILLIGGGNVAAFKLKVLLPFTDNITVMAPEINEAIRLTGVTLIENAYSPHILEGFSLIYACTNNRELNRTVKEDAGKLRIPVNVVDDPEFCDFISPAVYSSENFCIAVSTFGNAPGGAAEIRDEIRNKLPPDVINGIVKQTKARRPKNSR